MPKKGYKKNKETGEFELVAEQIDNAEIVEAPEEETECGLEKCPVCGKALTSFVASNGQRFCSDLCVVEFNHEDDL